jgi:hypothetical protein
MPRTTARRSHGFSGALMALGLVGAVLLGGASAATAAPQIPARDAGAVVAVDAPTSVERVQAKKFLGYCDCGGTNLRLVIHTSSSAPQTHYIGNTSVGYRHQSGMLTTNTPVAPGFYPVYVDTAGSLSYMSYYCYCPPGKVCAV